jgi:type II secretory pathway pseudopilin PulG
MHKKSDHTYNTKCSNNITATVIIGILAVTLYSLVEQKKKKAAWRELQIFRVLHNLQENVSEQYYPLEMDDSITKKYLIILEVYREF